MKEEKSSSWKKTACNLPPSGKRIVQVKDKDLENWLRDKENGVKAEKLLEYVSEENRHRYLLGLIKNGWSDGTIANVLLLEDDAFREKKRAAMREFRKIFLKAVLKKGKGRKSRPKRESESAKGLVRKSFSSQSTEKPAKTKHPINDFTETESWLRNPENYFVSLKLLEKTKERTQSFIRLMFFKNQGPQTIMRVLDIVDIKVFEIRRRTALREFQKVLIDSDLEKTAEIIRDEKERLEHKSELPNFLRPDLRKISQPDAPKGNLIIIERPEKDIQEEWLKPAKNSKPRFSKEETEAIIKDLNQVLTECAAKGEEEVPALSVLKEARKKKAGIVSVKKEGGAVFPEKKPRTKTETTSVSKPKPKPKKEVKEKSIKLPEHEDFYEAEGQHDFLRQYLDEISKKPLLSREEEREVAERIHRFKDREAKKTLTESCLRLVVKIALEYHSYRIPLLDLIQEGNVGLMHAAEKFNPDKGTRFSTYAAFWIRAYMLKHIMDQWSVVKLGTTQGQRRMFYRLKREKKKLESLGITPTPEDLASVMKVKPKEVEEMETRLSYVDVSLDYPIYAEGEETFGDTLYSDVDVEGEVAKKEQLDRSRGKIADFRKILSERELYIFDKRVFAEDPLTLEELGDYFKISRESAPDRITHS